MLLIALTKQAGNLASHAGLPISRPPLKAPERAVAMAPGVQNKYRGRSPALAVGPLRTAIFYSALALVWVLASSLTDSLVLGRSPAIEMLVEVGKGSLFVFLTGALLYWLLDRVRRDLQAVQGSLDESRRTTEAERRRIERIAKIGHWIWRPNPGDNGWEGGRREYSESGAAIFGVSPADLAIQNADFIQRCVHPDDRQRVREYFFHPTVGEAGAGLIEYRIVRPGGAVRTIYEVTEIVRGVTGEPMYWQGTVQDVTEIRKIEANLADSESRFRDFAGVASQFQWELDENYRIVNYSGSPCELMPNGKSEIIGHTFRELAEGHPGISEHDWTSFEALLLSREAFQGFAYTARLGPGRTEYRRASARPIFDSAGKFKGYRGVTRDETKEVEARQRAQAAEELLSRAIESISDGFAIYDADDRMVMINSRFRESFPEGPTNNPLGKTFEELVRADVANGYYPEARGDEEAFIAARLAQHRQPGSIGIFKNDRGRWIQARDQSLPDGSIVAIRTDVTELVERDEALRQSQANLAAAQRIAKMGSWEYDLESLTEFGANPLRWSDETFRIFGQEPGKFDVSNESFYRIVAAEDHAMIRDAVERAVKGGIPYNVEYRVDRPDGSEIIVRDLAEVIRDPKTLRPLKMVGTVQDITEIKRTELALRQAQKMEAIGQLTGGIAHDFNNLLMVIGGNLELLQEGLEPNQQRLQQFAGVALDASLRGSQLTQRLLAFARRQSLKPEVIDLNQLIGNLTPLLGRTLGEQIRIETALAADVWRTMCDGGQVENALLNLAVNARDAMPEGGQLTITTENLHLDRAWVAKTGDLPAGDYVLLSVNDTGQGMAPEVRERAFEPFFTTKATGRGTGLGLSMVYGFVMQSGGRVRIDSELGRGTTVRIYLPRTDEFAQPAPSEVDTLLPRGHERILLVEDEAMVRGTVALILQDLGYGVSEASDGSEALSSIAANPPFDLVLSDMVMPGGLSGWDLAQSAWVRQPRLKFLFSTGYTDSPILQQAHLDSRIHVLPKPYSKRALATILRSVIDQPAG